MFEDIHVQNTFNAIEISVLEPNNELNIPVELGVCDAEHVTQWFDCNGMKANPEMY